MAKHTSDFLNVLAARGFVHQCSDFAGLDALAAKGEIVAYVGYDCTAPSLHVGSLISIMMMHWLQQTGNKPITLMGAARPGSAIRRAGMKLAPFARSRRSKPIKTASRAYSASF